MDALHFVNAFIGLLVITNPLMILPAALAVMKRLSLPQKKKMALIATLVSAAILIAMTWLGPELLQLLGIQAEAFKIAGGIVVIMIAFSMLNAQESTLKTTAEEQQSKNAGAIIPLAFPIIAGPGAISTTIINAVSFPGIENKALLFGACILSAALAGLVLYFSDRLERYLGQMGINIFTRIGGLILLSLGIQILGIGIQGFFPGSHS